MKEINYYRKGQTLVILLTYMLIAIIVTTASIALVLNSAKGADKLYQGNNSLEIAESGAESAMIKLLRDTNYSGETISVGGGQATITVTGINPKIIHSKGTINNSTRIIQVTVNTSNNTMTVTSWKEI